MLGRDTLTKKHFEALARALKSVKPLKPSGPKDPLCAAWLQWLDSVDVIVGVCKEFNSKFDAARFFEACGGDD